MNHQAFVAHRRTLRGLGASDVAKACGLSPYGGPLDLYLEKVGLKPPIDTPATRWGLQLEETIAVAYAETTGRMLYICPETWRHPVDEWIFAHPDRLASGPDEPSRFVELKTARSEWDEQDGQRQRVWGEEGTDQVPRGYFLQAQWQMLAAATSGIQQVDIAVLIAGSDFRIYPIPANAEAQKLLWGIGFAAWQMIERRQPPAPDWTDPRTPELVALLHRPTEGKRVELNDEAAVYASNYLAWGEEKRDAEEKQAHCKGRLIELMGDAAEGALPDGRTIRRKLVAASPPKMSEGRREYYTFSISHKAKEQP